MASNFSASTLTKVDANSVSSTLSDAIAQANTNTSKYMSSYVPTSVSKLIPSTNTQQSTATSKKPADPLDNYKVKLISATTLHTASPGNVEYVVFNATPTVNEDRTVEYTPVSPIHMPGSVQVYKRTAARTFGLTIPLVSRTREEARDNMRILQTLRGWTMPYFGSGSSTGGTTEPKGPGSTMRRSTELLGAPPDVLYFYAYSSPSSRDNKSHVNLNRIPVVISQLSISYPDDVDYIPTLQDNKEPMPVKMTVTLSLLETHAPIEFEQFSLQSYKSGKLQYF